MPNMATGVLNDEITDVAMGSGLPLVMGSVVRENAAPSLAGAQVPAPALLLLSERSSVMLDGDQGQFDVEVTTGLARSRCPARPVGARVELWRYRPSW
jgi:hypothetical protein